MFGMFIDSLEEEDITEYRVPDKRRMKREMQAYEEAEREDKEHERNNSGNYAGGRENIL